MRHRPPWARFSADCRCKRVPNSRLLDVTFATTDPKLAAADCQCARQQLHRAEFPQPLRSDNSGLQLAGGSAR